MLEMKIEQIKNLTERLNQYRNEYYNLNAPSVTDEVYDRLFDELVKLERSRKLGVQVLTEQEFLNMADNG